MRVKMKFVTKLPSYNKDFEMVVIELVGAPKIVDVLKQQLMEFMKKQENPEWECY